jgi:hypothetical protein
MTLADNIEQAAQDGITQGLRDFAEAVVEEAKRNIPIGDPTEDPDAHIRLDQSSDIEVIRNPLGDLLRVSFNTAYAAKQHEDMRLRHPRGGGPKYLERALTTLMPRFQDFVASKVDGELSTGKLSDPRRNHRRRR